MKQPAAIEASPRTRAATTYFWKCRPAAYRVEFEQAGFKKNLRKDVTVEINQVLTLNMTMQLGEAREVVEVTSEAPLVETTSTQTGRSR